MAIRTEPQSLMRRATYLGRALRCSPVIAGPLGLSFGLLDVLYVFTVLGLDGWTAVAQVLMEA